MIEFYSVISPNGKSGQNKATNSVIEAIKRNNIDNVISVPNKSKSKIDKLNHVIYYHFIHKSHNYIVVRYFPFIFFKFHKRYNLLVRGNAIKKPGIFNYTYNKIILKYAQHIFVAFTDLADFIHHQYHIDKKRISILYNGVDKNIFPERKKIRTRKGHLRLLFVGSLKSRHGINILLNALNNIPNEKIYLRVVGEGPEKRTLESYAKDRALQVEFTGYVSQDKIVKYTNDIDLAYAYINPEFESNPIKIYEYLVLNIPVILNKHYEFNFIQDNNYGFFFDGSVNGLENLLIELMNKQEDFNIQSRKYILENFSWDNFAKTSLEFSLND